jgi:hypothetical protein
MQNLQQHRHPRHHQPKQQHTPIGPIVVAILITIGALVLVAALAGTGLAPAIHAAPVRQAALETASQPTFGVPHEVSKTTLGETSIDGPSLDSVGNETVLAWTGTDPAHHLNVETSTDGLHYGHKLILNETSPFRPDVAVTPVQTGFVVVLAWTGTDPNHSLNVLFDVYGSSPKKLTLHNENSFTAPALLFGPCLCLAWTGTNATHSLNVLQLSVTSSAIVPGTKTTLSQDSSDAGPHLRRGSATVMDLLWSTRGTLQLRIAAGTHADALQPGTAVDGETSAAAPDAFVLGPFLGLGSQEWIGWTGTDPAHHLNLFPFAGNPAPTKTILSDTAIDGPALSFNTAANANLLAWTGTDAAHHLNVATFV